MRLGRLVGGFLLGAVLCVGPADAQALRARSTEYLTVAGADDVRATWVNPAGLARVLEASIMAEAVVDRVPEVALAQYSLGLNSRGFSVAHARDRAGSTAAVSLTRFALGLPFGRATAGVGVTLFGAAGRGKGVDVGLGYRLTRAVDVAAAVRNLRRPSARGVQQPIVAVAGARWRLVPGLAAIEAEAVVADSGAGFGQPRYHGMLRITRRGQSPIHLFGGVLLDRSRIEQWVLGLAVGSPGWLGIVGGASRANGLERPDRFSVTGVASHRAGAAR